RVSHARTAEAGAFGIDGTSEQRPDRQHEPHVMSSHRKVTPTFATLQQRGEQGSELVHGRNARQLTILQGQRQPRELQGSALALPASPGRAALPEWVAERRLPA